MKISYSWLKEYIKIDKNPEIIAEVLTDTGLEVEGTETFEQVKGGLKGLVIGEVLTCVQHSGADKLRVTTVDVGADEPLPIVCGAPNVAKGQKVVVALVGTTLYADNGESFKIKKAKIRGEASQGMICAEDEIGLGEGHDGIMELDTDLPNGTSAAEFFNLKTDTVFEIGLTPNRADAASHFGTARDLKAFYELDLQKPSVTDFKVENTNTTIKVDIQNTEACPRFSGISITEITINPSPEWLQTRLKSIGLTPINNVVDITNYVLHSFGQPLHAYDLAKVADNKIIVKTLAKDTKFLSLDEKERKLSAKDLMICDGKENPMCIGGVFGGLNSGVSESTTSIFLESAYFSPEYIRRSANFHELSTDASYRFARGTDPRGTIYALKYAALLIKELAGGVVSSEIIDIYPKEIQNFEISVKYKNIDRLIGKSLDKDLIKKILVNLDIEVKEETAETLSLSVPPYRVDVQREADIVEEILRIYGFNNIELEEDLQTDYLSNFPKIDDAKIQRQVSQLLAANSYSEMFCNSLTSSRYTENIASIDNAKNVVILNKLSEDLDIMRQTMIFSGLEAIAHNINRKNSDLKLFEFGRTYHLGDNPEKTLNYKEKFHLSMFLSGNKTAPSWLRKSKKVDFYDLAALVQKVLAKVNLTNLQSQKITNDDCFDYGLALGKKIGRDEIKEVVRFGLLKKKITKLNKVNQEVFYAEFDWDYVLKNINLKKNYAEISKFPAVYRDLSLVISKQVSFEEVERVARKTERKLLKEISVFDIYEGDRIEQNKKAYAMTFVLQDQHKTLNDKVIDKTMQRLMNAFKNELGAVIRGEK